MFTVFPARFAWRVLTGAHYDARRSMELLGLDGADLAHLLRGRLLHRELMRSGKDSILEKTPGHTLIWQRIAACWPQDRAGQVQGARELPTDLITPEPLKPLCVAWGYPISSKPRR